MRYKGQAVLLSAYCDLKMGELCICLVVSLQFLLWLFISEVFPHIFKFSSIMVVFLIRQLGSRIGEIIFSFSTYTIVLMFTFSTKYSVMDQEKSVEDCLYKTEAMWFGLNFSGPILEYFVSFNNSQLAQFISKDFNVMVL